MSTAAKELASRAFTFATDEKTDGILDTLKSKLGTTSKAEVIRKAIALLDVAAAAKDSGKEIAIVDNEGHIITKIVLV